MDLQSIMDRIGKSPLYGKPIAGAKEFDDAEACAGMNLALPKQVDFRQGVIVDGLAFAYGQKTLAHGGQGGSPNSFRLEENEHIVRAEGKFSPWGGGTIMDLMFITDKGRSFGKGHPAPGAEGYFSYEAPKGQAIFGLHGRADHYLRNIGFYTCGIKSGGSLFPGGNPFAGLGK